MNYKHIPSDQIISRLKWLEEFLAKKPDIVDGDWADMENRQNDGIEEDAKEEIEALKKELNSRGVD